MNKFSGKSILKQLAEKFVKFLISKKKGNISRKLKL
jgi:hypothetical protein